MSVLLICETKFKFFTYVCLMGLTVDIKQLWVFSLLVQFKKEMEKPISIIK